MGLALTLILTGCKTDNSRSDMEEGKFSQEGNFHQEDGRMTYEGRKFNIDKRNFKLSGDFANYGEVRDLSILFGSIRNKSRDEKKAFKEIFMNLNFWHSQRFLSESSYNLIEKIDEETSTYEVKSKNKEYMKIYMWGNEKKHYILVIGQDKKMVDEKFNEILK